MAQYTPSIKLNLDEALIKLNSSNIKLTPLDVYYQLDECYGCPAEKLTSLNVGQEEFVMRTKYDFHLELKQQNGISVCKLDQLSLNNQGLYQINVLKKAAALLSDQQASLVESRSLVESSSSSNTSAQTYECSFQTLDDGQCLMCPLAMLVFFLLLISCLESFFYSGSFLKRRQQGTAKAEEETSQQKPSEETLVSGDCSEQSGVDNSSPTTVSVGGVVKQTTSVVDSTTKSETKSSRKRIDSLDAFRGLTIAGMIMVNYGGAGLTPLKHKAWDGLTCADLVFPFFIFSMGASVAISTRHLFSRGTTIGCILGKIVRRSVILMSLGLCLNSKWLDGKSLYDLRLTGVLQRFSISYLIVASMYTLELFSLRWIKSKDFYRSHLVARLVATSVETCTALGNLIVYLYFSLYFEYSDTCPAGYLGPGGQTANGAYANCTGGAAAYIDHYLIGQRHLYHDHEVEELYLTKVSHDPEGLLGYTTSILLTLIGLQCGKSLIDYKEHRARLIMFSKWTLLLALASSSSLLIPINKRLWSLSFVTVTGCLAFVCLTLLYLLMDFRECKRIFLLRLLVDAGKNSIFLYVGHSLLTNMLPWWFKVPNESSHLQLLARLTWATFVWLLVAHYMAAKKLFIRV